MTITPLPSPAGAMAAEPFVSADTDGSLILSWLQREADSSVTLTVASQSADGQWGTPQVVIRARDLFVNWADFPSVVTLADGRLLAHWLQRNGAGKYAYDVRLSTSADRGRSWTAPMLPHDAGVPAEHGFVTLVPRPDSGADVLFLHGAPPASGAAAGDASGPMRLAHARWQGGGAAGPPAFLDQRTCDCCQTAAARTSRGLVVLYRDRSEQEVRDISVLREVDGRWTTPAPLHRDNWVINACPVNGPAIAASGTHVAAVWFTNARDTAKVQVAFSDDAGATFGAPVRIDAGAPVGRVDVELLADGDALVTWLERTGAATAEVRARVVSPATGPEPARTIAATAPGRTSGFPRMTRRGNDVVLAWTDPADSSRIRLARLQVGPR